MARQSEFNANSQLKASARTKPRPVTSDNDLPLVKVLPWVGLFVAGWIAAPFIWPYLRYAGEWLWAVFA